MTIQQLIEECGITMKAAPSDRNPHMEGSNNMDNWLCRFRGRKLGGATMSVHFSKGYAHNGAEPTADEVLDCLAMDASGIENATDSFELWCDEYGYDADSRKAEKTFKACERQAASLNRFLGSDYYKELLWNTERL